MSMQPALLIDLSAQVHRAYHAHPDLQYKGKPTGAVFGFWRFLKGALQMHKPSSVLVAVDAPRDSLYRRQIHPPYKADRPKADKGLKVQLSAIQDLCVAAGFICHKVERMEADDVLASAATQWGTNGTRCIIAGADKDMHQIVSEDISLWDAKSGKTWDTEAVVDKWGVPPNRVAHIQALMGDTTDGFPGVMGCGEKTACKLIKEFGTVKGVYNSRHLIPGKLGENIRKTNLRLMYRLARLDCCLEVPDAKDCLRDVKAIRSPAVRELLDSHGIRSM